MDYQKIYNQIIDRAVIETRRRGIDVYYERHHIIPRCLGGADDVENLVNLTAREHFIAHKLLCEIYSSNIKLFHAYWMMCNMKSNTQKRNYNIGNREYERLRVKFGEIQHLNRIGKKLSDATKQKMRKPKSAETKQLLSRQRLGKLKSAEHKQKIGNAHRGKRISDETKQKMRAAKLGKPKSEEHKQKMRDSARKRWDK